MLEFYTPRPGDLWFREKFMSDEQTMSYNHAWGGTIPFPESEWQDWYDRWVLCDDGSRFYRYLKDTVSGEYVGEAAYHFDDERKLWMTDIIIAAEFRGRGYGRLGLEMLCRLAAEHGIEFLYDDMAADNPAVSMFIKSGFIEEYRTEDIIMLKKDLR